jgi:hypothetical protein
MTAPVSPSAPVAWRWQEYDHPEDPWIYGDTGPREHEEHANLTALYASPAPSMVGLREKVARICGGSTVENMGTHPFEGDANDLDWSSWQFADAILALLARGRE